MGLSAVLHVKQGFCNFTWKTIPRMGPTNSIPDSKQIGLQKKTCPTTRFFLLVGVWRPTRLLRTRPPSAASRRLGPLPARRLTGSAARGRALRVRASFLLCLTKRKKPRPTTRFFFWSECGGSNSRPLRPERSALPTALHPDMSCGKK